MFDVSNPSIEASIISVIGGALFTFFFTKYGKKIVGRPKKDRLDEVFNGYDRFIFQLQRENKRQEKLIYKMEKHTDYLEKLADKQRHRINEQLEKLADVNNQLDSARTKLQEVRAQRTTPDKQL